jgi:ATP-dependent DNA helicase RecG
MRPERLAAILAEPIEVVDWSMQTFPSASLDDLDPAAIALARDKFKERQSQAPFFDQIDQWDAATFLDRAKLTINGAVTRDARRGPKAAWGLCSVPPTGRN